LRATPYGRSPFYLLHSASALLANVRPGKKKLAADKRASLFVPVQQLRKR